MIALVHWDIYRMNIQRLLIIFRAIPSRIKGKPGGHSGIETYDQNILEAEKSIEMLLLGRDTDL